MKLVIFIGHFKTGSSSLQRFLCRNFLTLLRAGILYPSIESEGMARNLAAAMRGSDFDDMRVSLNVTEPHNALALRLKTEEDGHGVPDYYPNVPSGFQIFQMIDWQIFSLMPENMIFCSEVFSLFGLTSERKSLQRMANRFSHHDVTIYCNLRRPDEYLSSWHRQRLKFGGPIQSLRAGALKHYLGTAHFEQDVVLRAWADAFPQATIKARNFDNVRREGGSIPDFMAHSGIAFPSDLAEAGEFNPSVPCAFAEIGRRALETPDVDGRSVVAWLVSAAKRVDHVPDTDVEMFGEDNRRLLSDAFAGVHERLSDLLGVQPFYPDSDDFAKLRPVSDLDAAKQALPALIKDSENFFETDDVANWLRVISL